MILRQLLAAATATAIVTMPTMSAALSAPGERQADADITSYRCRDHVVVSNMALNDLLAVENDESSGVNPTPRNA